MSIIFFLYVSISFGGTMFNGDSIQFDLLDIDINWELTICILVGLSWIVKLLRLAWEMRKDQTYVSIGKGKKNFKVCYESK